MTLTGPLAPGKYIMALDPVEDMLSMDVAEQMTEYFKGWGIELAFVTSKGGTVPLYSPAPVTLTKGDPARLTPSPHAKGFWAAWVESWCYTPQYWIPKDTI